MGLDKIELDLKRNVEIHNKLALKYQRMHGEIYNDFEQSRIKLELSGAIAEISTSSTTKVALDFGCGAGNLTRHLSDLGCEVWACDIAQGFLNLVASKRYPTKVRTISLNGRDLVNITDCSVDMVATYSVLHHIPDYLGVLEEFMRILKPGGVVYIDHEPSDEFWLENKIYCEFRSEMQKAVPANLAKYFVWTNYYDWLIRKFINPRYQREGDIHVFHDDHVEWPLVIESLCRAGGSIVASKSYLLFRRGYDRPVYTKYMTRTTDMHVLVVKKIEKCHDARC